MNLDIVIVSIYLIGLMSLGWIFSRFNNNLSDYIRGGARGTWWLTGSSMLIASVSAFAFTGNASAAFSAGPTFSIIYIANCVGYLVCALWLGPWLRQSRAHTVADLYRERFGPEVEQFQVVFGMFIGPFGAAIQLWALALFASSILEIPVLPTIIAIGGIVIFYSTTGGRWAVMATDFAQGMLLFGMTAIVFILALHHVGGFDAFFGYFSDERFSEDFKYVKEPGAFPDDKFTWKWIIVIFFMQVYGHIGMTGAHRFLSIKDGSSARKAAWFALVLMIIGTIIWFLPPMVARFLHESDVLALAGKDPATQSYAFLAQQLLPKGMMGLIVAAMFAATMSSMDTGLNNQTGVIVNNFIPWIRRMLKRPEMSDASNIRICRLVTIGLGLFIIGICVALSKQERFPLFDAYLTIASVLGIPMGFPITVGLWIKKLPRWSYFLIFGCCLMPSIYSFVDEIATGVKWSIQDRAMWIFIFGIGGTILSRALYFTSSDKYKTRLDAFFQKMHTPVDFDKEIGGANDDAQGRILGGVCLVMGLGALLLIAVPNPLWGRMCFLALSAFMILVGSALLKLSAKSR